MTNKNAKQVAQHIKHFFPQVGTRVYKRREAKDTWAVEITYGPKPDIIRCFNVNEYKDAKKTLAKAFS